MNFFGSEFLQMNSNWTKYLNSRPRELIARFPGTIGAVRDWLEKGVRESFSG